MPAGLNDCWPSCSLLETRFSAKLLLPPFPPSEDLISLSQEFCRLLQRFR